MKSLKKIISVMLLFTLVLGVYGCGAKSPSDIAKEYLEQVKKGENGDFTKLLNDTMESKGQEEKASDESTKKIMETMSKLTYTINSEKIEGDTATVNVKVKGPDISKVMGEFIQKAFSSALATSFSGSKMSKEETDKLYEGILAECLNNVEYVERTGDISLTKTNDEWKINNDDSLVKLLMGIDLSLFKNKAN